MSDERRGRPEQGASGQEAPEQQPPEGAAPGGSDSQGVAPGEATAEAAAGQADAAAAKTAVPAGQPAGTAEGGNRGMLRLIGAIVALPWLLLYGTTGVWAVGLAARAAGEGLKEVDAGYTSYVTPAQLAFVGALLVVAFAAVLGCGLLLLFRRRSPAAWVTLLLVAAGLTAGAVWAGARGHLNGLIWAFLFFGLVYVLLIAAVQVVNVTRAVRRGTISRP